MEKMMLESVSLTRAAELDIKVETEAQKDGVKEK